MKDQQRLVDQFNQNTPIGSTVFVRMDDGEIRKTATLCEAWLLGDHTPVVKVGGISGAYLLSRVTKVDRMTPASPSAPSAQSAVENSSAERA